MTPVKQIPPLIFLNFSLTTVIFGLTMISIRKQFTSRNEESYGSDARGVLAEGENQCLQYWQPYRFCWSSSSWSDSTGRRSESCRSRGPSQSCSPRSSGENL